MNIFIIFKNNAFIRQQKDGTEGVERKWQSFFAILQYSKNKAFICIFTHCWLNNMTMLLFPINALFFEQGKIAQDNCHFLLTPSILSFCCLVNVLFWKIIKKFWANKMPIDANW